MPTLLQLLENRATAVSVPLEGVGKFKKSKFGNFTWMEWGEDDTFPAVVISFHLLF